MDDIKIAGLKSLKDNGVYAVKFKTMIKPEAVSDFISALNDVVREHNIVFIPEVEGVWEFTTAEIE